MVGGGGDACGGFVDPVDLAVGGDVGGDGYGCLGAEGVGADGAEGGLLEVVGEGLECAIEGDGLVGLVDEDEGLAEECVGEEAGVVIVGGGGELDLEAGDGGGEGLEDDDGVELIVVGDGAGAAEGGGGEVGGEVVGGDGGDAAQAEADVQAADLSAFGEDVAVEAVGLTCGVDDDAGLVAVDGEESAGVGVGADGDGVGAHEDACVGGVVGVVGAEECGFGGDVVGIGGGGFALPGGEPIGDGVDLAPIGGVGGGAVGDVAPGGGGWCDLLPIDFYSESKGDVAVVGVVLYGSIAELEASVGAEGVVVEAVVGLGDDGAVFDI